MHLDWRTMTLAEAGVKLIDCDHRTPPAADEGFHYITIPQLKEGRIDPSSARRISPEHYSEWTKKANPQPDDVVLSRRCNPGESAVVPVDLKFALGQNLVLLRADGSAIRPKFLRWLVRSTVWWEQVRRFLNVGAVFDSLKCKDIPNFQLPIPPLYEQTAIASILESLDDKIDLNRRMNETLESMARALFRSWFFHFSASTHPSSRPLYDSPLGPLPEGWSVQALPNIIEVNPSRKLGKQELAPYTEMKDLPESGCSIDQPVLRAFTSGSRFRNGDTLLARITPCLENGKTGLVNFLEDGQLGWGSTEFIVMAPKPPVPPQFVYLLARMPEFRAHAIQNMVGSSGRQRVPIECFNSYNLPVPPPGVFAVFDEATRHYFELIRNNDLQSRTLAALRDTLLPKLISGELRLPEFEQKIGSAL